MSCSAMLSHCVCYFIPVMFLSETVGNGSTYLLPEVMQKRASLQNWFFDFKCHLVWVYFTLFPQCKIMLPCKRYLYVLSTACPGPARCQAWDCGEPECSKSCKAARGLVYFRLTGQDSTCTRSNPCTCECRWYFIVVVADEVYWTRSSFFPCQDHICLGVPLSWSQGKKWSEIIPNEKMFENVRTFIHIFQQNKFIDWFWPSLVLMWGVSAAKVLHCMQQATRAGDGGNLLEGCSSHVRPNSVSQELHLIWSHD